MKTDRLQAGGVWLVTALLSAVLLIGCGGPSEAELIASAKEKLAANDVKGAEIQIKNALQKNPDSADARFLLGKALLDSGDARTALVELQKAIDLQAPEHLVLPEVARAMLLTGEGSKLLAQYGETKLSDPAASADFQTSLATAYAQEGKIDKARARLDLALKSRPGYAAALILDGRIMMSEGNFDGAITVLDKVLATNRAMNSAGLLKGELLHRARTTWTARWPPIGPCWRPTRSQ
jgi:lipopolysaccharide biosynthesis regulator YciM